MRVFLIHQLQREPAELEAISAPEARAQLRYIAKQELFRCRSRFKSGTLHKFSDTSYLITIGKDKRSSVWTSLALSEVQS